MKKQPHSNCSDSELFQMGHDDSANPVQGMSRSKQPAKPEMKSTMLALTTESSESNTTMEWDFFQLVEQYYPRVFQYAFRLSGSRHDAEDLAQQTFLIAQRKLDQLREHEKVGGWLTTILRSCFLKSIRRTRPSSESVLQLSVDQLPRGGSTFEPIDQLELQDALIELREDYRIVVVMFYFDNFSYKEIAEELGIKIGTVMSRLSRAKSLLRLRLGDQQDDSINRSTK